MLASRILIGTSIVLLSIIPSCSLTNPKYKNLTKENSISNESELLESSLVINMRYKQNVIGGYYEYTQVGSGVIFYEDNENYYALTNNHVLYKTGISKSTIFIQEKDGKEHQATLEKKNANYDLAVVSFKKSDCSCSHRIVHLSEKNPSKGESVSAVDNYYKVTEGIVLRYEKGKDLNTYYGSSNVTFDVITSSTYIHQGSSGGPLVDKDFNLVGIVYASMNYSDGTFINSYIIPIEKVKYFLENL